MTDKIEEVYIGDKLSGKYVNAGLWAIKSGGVARLMGRGHNIKRCVDVTEILKRKLNNPETHIEIWTEEYMDKKTKNLLKVSVIAIEITGTIKNEDE